MRFPNLVPAFLVAAAFLLASGRASAQSATTAQPNSDFTKTGQLGLARALKFDFNRVSNWMQAANSNTDTTSAQRARALELLRTAERMRLQATPPKQDVCYSLNVYKFSQEDDQVPRMTGATTCTPADRFAVKSTDIVVTHGSKTGQASK